MINAPLIWILFPGGMAVVLWLLQRYQRLTTILVTGFCAFLAAVAATLPIGIMTNVGPWVVEIRPELVILGRRLVLADGDRTLLLLLYGMGAFWFFGSVSAGSRRSFQSLGLTIITLCVAAMAVEPFLYAAVLIEVVVLVSVPLLVDPKRTSMLGLVRYLIFQTLALPFILFAGWAAAGVEANPAESKLIIQAVVLLGLGFAFWLAVFPFHTWVPMLTEEAPIFEVTFILVLLPMTVLLLMLDFLNSFNWLRTHPLISEALRLSGLLMVVTGGVWAAFQRSVTKLLGYAVILESGFMLVSLSFQNQMGMQLMASSLLPRLLALALCALALAVFARSGVNADMDGMAGQIRRFPLASTALALGFLSIAGIPLLAGFPVRIALLQALAQQSLQQALLILLGSLGFLVATLRLIATLVASRKVGWKLAESWMQVALLFLGQSALLLVGLFPKEILTGLWKLLETFKNL
jgi:NADH-quinone oxidoreductase subunit N